MSAPVSQIQQTPAQPVGAFGLGGTKEFRAGHYVVNPPVIKPYSFYNEIKGNTDFYKELISAGNKTYSGAQTAQPRTAKGILKAAALAGTAALAIVYRKNIYNFLSEAFTKIKNIIKK